MLNVLPIVAQASGGGVVSKMTGAICSLLSPLVGQNSTILSLVFLIVLGVMIFLWMLNENKEGIIVWILRVGLALSVLINIFTLPTLIGLPPVCGGG